MVIRQETEKYSVEELSSFLTTQLADQEQEDVATLIDAFRSNRITGSMFLHLSIEELKEIVPIIGDRKRIKSIIDSFSTVVSQEF